MRLFTATTKTPARLSLALLFSTSLAFPAVFLQTTEVSARPRAKSASAEEKPAANQSQAQDNDPELKACLAQATQSFARGDTQAALATLKAWQSKFPGNQKDMRTVFSQED